MTEREEKITWRARKSTWAEELKRAWAADSRAQHEGVLLSGYAAWRRKEAQDG